MSRTKRTTNVHHLWWPARDYTTPVERMFRELLCHRVEISVMAHECIHRNQSPPRKPSVQEMLDIIKNHELGRCTCNVIGPEVERRRRGG